MAQNYRQSHEPGRPEAWRDRPSGRGERWGRHQTGAERDRHETGNERRYSSDWDEDPGRGYEGERSYSAGGYPEEFGYRRDYGRERQYGQDPQYTRGGFRGERSRSYGDVGRVWSEEQHSEPSYYGTGRHYGGGFGTAAGTQAASTGWSSASDYGQGGWSERESDWLPESGGERGYGQQRFGNEYGTQGYGGQRHQGQASFRGRGPRGYERSDERLKEMICERLTDDPRIDAGDITVEVTQKVVKLTGSVDDRRTKYEVEELVEHLGGVKDIDNQLRVQPQQWSGASSGQDVGGTSTTSSSTTGTKRG